MVVLAGVIPSLADTQQDLRDAYQLVRDGRFLDAIAKYQAIMGTDTARDVQCQCLFWTGIAYEGLEKDDEPIAAWQRLVALDPDYRWPEVLYRLAVHTRRKGDKGGATAYIQRLKDRRRLEPDPKLAMRSDLLLGCWLETTEAWDDGLSHYQSMRPLWPSEDQDILYHIAFCAHRAGKSDAALAAIKEYVGKYRDNARFGEVALKAVEVYRADAKFKEALDYLDQLLADEPRLRGRILVTKSEVLVDGFKDAEGSIAAARQVVAEDSDPYVVYLAKYRIGVAYLYFQHKSIEGRLQLLEIVDQYPKDNLAIEIAHDIAYSYYQQGDYTTAAQRYLDALAKYPCRVPSWEALTRYMAGHSYNCAGDRAKAAEVWTELAKKFPDSAWTRQALDEEDAWAHSDSG
jgi:tetratricopeptide (TPR) repeat protein